MQKTWGVNFRSNPSKGKSKSGKQYYGCSLCKKEIAKKYYKNHFDEIKIKSSERHQKRKLDPTFKIKKKKWMHDYQKRKRLLRPDEVRLKNKLEKRIFYRRHRDKIINYHRDMSNNLHPVYVKNYLKRHYGFSNPSNELIHAKATLMLLRREIMTLNANRGKNKYVKKTRKYPRRSQNKDAERAILESTTEDFKKGKDI